MTKNSSVLRRLLAIFAMLSLTLLGTAVASDTAEAAPYNNNSISITVTFGTNSQGQEIVTVTISNGEPNTVYEVQIHSTPVTLGTITTDANGNGSGTFVVPAGFSGSHTIVVINTKTGQATSTTVDVPASGGSTPVSSGGSGSASSGGLPNTGAAILGVGVLALAFLAGGGVLLAMGRKRGRAKQTV